MPSLIDLIAPRECLSCGALGPWLCEPCADTVPLLIPPPCPSCGNALLIGGRVHDACRSSIGLDRLIISTPLHQRFINMLVYGMKYHGLRSAAAILARFCVRALYHHAVMPPASPDNRFARLDLARLADESRRASQGGPASSERELGEPAAPYSSTVCVPIPLFRQKERYRGFNQASLIAREIANLCGISYAEILDGVRPTRDQIGLTKDERRSNLQGAFTAARPLDDTIETVLLVDDVTTTGATMRSAAEALRAAAKHPLTIIGVAAAYHN